jgi:hypothetical protein
MEFDTVLPKLFPNVWLSPCVSVVLKPFVVDQLVPTLVPSFTPVEADALRPLWWFVDEEWDSPVPWLSLRAEPVADDSVMRPSGERRCCDSDVDVFALALVPCCVLSDRPSLVPSPSVTPAVSVCEVDSLRPRDAPVVD